MNLDTISAITTSEITELGNSFENLSAQKGDSFTTWFEREIGVLNEQISTSESALRSLATGETDNIHHVMLSLEKAKLSFQLMLQVRNKALEAYQEMMRMQL
jgi:flagellar hook-basal body complex protein FliE